MISDQISTFADLMDRTTGLREPFFAIARNYCREGAKVLDIGAGSGEFARQLTHCNVFLMEGNSRTAADLRKEFGKVFHHQVPDAFPFDAGSFDVIHCSHLVEHLHPQDVYSLMLEVERCLAPGGHFIVSAPLLWERFYNDLSHVRPYPPSVFINYLCSTGDGPRTRAIVSKRFRPVELRYRFTREPVPHMWMFGTKRSLRWMQRMVFFLSIVLRRLGLSMHRPSAYTLVLQKTQDA